MMTPHWALSQQAPDDQQPVEEVLIDDVEAIPGEDPEEDIVEEPAEATAPPRSILFPDNEPGPYIPPVIEEAVIEEDLALADAISDPAFPGIDNSEDDFSDLSQDLDPLLGDQQDDGEIIVGELDQSDNMLFGIYNAENGGFSNNLWQNSDPARLEKLMGLLPTQFKSAVMRDLFDRLLMSAAFGPGTPEPDALNDTAEADQTFLLARVSKMADGGNLQKLSQFLEAIPIAQIPANRDYIDRFLLIGDYTAACDLARRAREAAELADSLVPTDPFLMKMQAFCQTMQGNSQGAYLAIDLLLDSGEQDIVFLDLINRVLEQSQNANNGNAVGSDVVLTLGYEKLDALTFSLLKILEQPADASLLSQSALLVNFAVASTVGLPDEMRLAAAKESYENGVYPVALIRSLYDAQQFSTSEYENALDLTIDDDSQFADILLYQAAGKQISDRDTAAMLQAIWERAATQNDLPRAAALNIDTVRKLKPSQELILQAHDIARAHLLVGDIEEAKSWYNFVRTEAYNGNSEATKALIDIWPLMVLFDQDDQTPWSAEIIDLWWNSQMLLAPENRFDRATVFFAVCEALGHTVPENMWQELDGAITPDTVRPMALATWRQLVQTMQEDKMGESLMLTLMGLGTPGPGNLDAAGLSVSLRALRVFGLEEEARRLALEALVARGL